MATLTASTDEKKQEERRISIKPNDRLLKRLRNKRNNNVETTISASMEGIEHAATLVVQSASSPVSVSASVPSNSSNKSLVENFPADNSTIQQDCAQRTDDSTTSSTSTADEKKLKKKKKRRTETPTNSESIPSSPTTAPMIPSSDHRKQNDDDSVSDARNNKRNNVEKNDQSSIHSSIPAPVQVQQQQQREEKPKSKYHKNKQTGMDLETEHCSSLSLYEIFTSFACDEAQLNKQEKKVVQQYQDAWLIASLWFATGGGEGNEQKDDRSKPLPPTGSTNDKSSADISEHDEKSPSGEYLYPEDEWVKKDPPLFANREQRLRWFRQRCDKVCPPWFAYNDKKRGPMTENEFHWWKLNRDDPITRHHKPPHDYVGKLLTEQETDELYDLNQIVADLHNSPWIDDGDCSVTFLPDPRQRQFPPIGSPWESTKYPSVLRGRWWHPVFDEFLPPGYFYVPPSSEQYTNYLGVKMLHCVSRKFSIIRNPSLPIIPLLDIPIETWTSELVTLYLIQLLEVRDMIERYQDYQHVPYPVRMTKTDLLLLLPELVEVHSYTRYHYQQYVHDELALRVVFQQPLRPKSIPEPTLSTPVPWHPNLVQHFRRQPSSSGSIEDWVQEGVDDTSEESTRPRLKSKLLKIPYPLLMSFGWFKGMIEWGYGFSASQLTWTEQEFSLSLEHDLPGWSQVPPEHESKLPKFQGELATFVCQRSAEQQRLSSTAMVQQKNAALQAQNKMMKGALARFSADEQISLQQQWQQQQQGRVTTTTTTTTTKTNGSSLTTKKRGKPKSSSASSKSKTTTAAFDYSHFMQDLPPIVSPMDFDVVFVTDEEQSRQHKQHRDWSDYVIVDFEQQGFLLKPPHMTSHTYSEIRAQDERERKSLLAQPKTPLQILQEQKAAAEAAEAARANRPVQPHLFERGADGKLKWIPARLEEFKERCKKNNRELPPGFPWQ